MFSVLGPHFSASFEGGMVKHRARQGDPFADDGLALRGSSARLYGRLLGGNDRQTFQQDERCPFVVEGG